MQRIPSPIQFLKLIFVSASLTLTPLLASSEKKAEDDFSDLKELEKSQGCSIKKMKESANSKDVLAPSEQVQGKAAVVKKAAPVPDCLNSKGTELPKEKSKVR